MTSPSDDLPGETRGDRAAIRAARRAERRHGLRAVPSPDPGLDSGPDSGPDPSAGPETDPAADPTADPIAAAPADPETEPAGAEPAAPTRRRRRRRRRRSKEGPSSTSATSPAAASAAADAAGSVRPARVRTRHWVAIAAFLAMVALPLAAVITYLWTRAADQYHSEVAFSIRSEEAASSTAGLLGALTQIGTGTASEADILFEYIRSQEIVEKIDAELDLRAIWTRATGDPVFMLGPDASIEALHAHWLRMVEVAYDSNAGIIHVEARAFAAEDARAIAAAILAESSALVNQLSEQAREDAIRFAREELDEAESALRDVRERLGDFRRRYNIVDPTADVAGQTGLLSALQAELAQALVDRDVLASYAGEGDQRLAQADRRIAAITARIEEERSSLDLTGVSGSLPEVVGAYEVLLVDLEFANTAYTQTLAGLAAARAEARRQSRYLAPHVRPTLATTALYPRRMLIAGLAALFLFLGWGMAMLIYYNIRDNR